MKKNKMPVILLLILCILFTIVMIIIGEISLMLFGILFIAVSCILLYKVIYLNSSNANYYKGTLRNILNTYDSLLVEIEEIPEINDKKIFRVSTFKDIVNAQYETRKPIYFIGNDYGHDFMVLDNKEVYAYTLRKNDLVKSLLDEYIENFVSDEIYEDVDKDIILDMADNISIDEDI